MIVNGGNLLAGAPVHNMMDHKAKAHGVSHGLTEAGYDLRIKQDVRIYPPNPLRYAKLMEMPVLSAGTKWEAEAAFHGYVSVDGRLSLGRFALASATEAFDMRLDLVGIVHDKSTWARRGLSVFNTVIEPGWRGFLTLELVHHGVEPLHIPAGSGIAQVLFHRSVEPAAYEGKYQDQDDQPVPAILQGGGV